MKQDIQDEGTVDLYLSLLKTLTTWHLKKLQSHSETDIGKNEDISFKYLNKTVEVMSALFFSLCSLRFPPNEARTYVNKLMDSYESDWEKMSAEAIAQWIANLGIKHD